MFKVVLFIVLCICNFSEAMVFHTSEITGEWTVEGISPFRELMFTWNGSRPSNGKFSFYIRAKGEEWSPWLLYATWGSDGQSTYKEIMSDVQVYQDAFEIKNGFANGFTIKIACDGDASLDQLSSLHVYTDADRFESVDWNGAPDLALPVAGLSQMKLDHPRYADLCSPSSTAAIVSFLSGRSDLNPVDFALRSWDGRFDIFGNWVFNVAQASAQLGSNWQGWVCRLSGFGEIYESLERGCPVVVSVRGPLPGSALPYSKGHLLVVRGFLERENRVLCMDPAFLSNDETLVSYAFKDFMDAWIRRGRVAYVFRPAQ